MARNPIGFKVTDSTAGWNKADFDDIFVRKDCFLEGGLWLWGKGTTGELGNNTALNSCSPIQTIAGGSNWKQVSLGGGHAAGIKTDGTLWLWGLNTAGPIGDNTTIARSSPVQTVSGGTNWRQVSLGFSISAAIKTDGTLWLWGSGVCGSIGDGTTAFRSSPVQTISGGNDWKQVSLSIVSSAAIKTDGTLWLWGGGDDGRLGTGNTLPRSSPVQTVSGGNNWKQVSLGQQHAAAIKTDGTLWLWGRSFEGELGTGLRNSRCSPVQTVSGGTDWRQVSLGSYTSAAIKTNGTLWFWGRGDIGQIGDGVAASRSSPVQTVSGGTNWRQVSVGERFSAAIKTDGTLWMWGANNYGQLGISSYAYRSSPVQTISGGTNWRQVSLTYFASAAIREDCW